jgi:peptide-methionine (S)-S-oxide reductase
MNPSREEKAMWFRDAKRIPMPHPKDAPAGRPTARLPREPHFVFGTALQGAFPGCDRAVFALGCFWGAEKRFWQVPGVRSTAVGYAGGTTPNPTYHEVCSGLTGHTEVVQVVYDPAVVSYETLLQVFWESHDPTQGMRQGNDLGTQYRSAVYTTTDAQYSAAVRSREAFGAALGAAGYGPITTELCPAGPFYFAEDYHQQYLAKNPDGYCGLGGTGVACPVELRR